MRLRHSLAAIAIAALAVFSANASAQKILDNVPSDAIAVAAWEGISAHKEVYAASRWKALADATDFQAQVKSIAVSSLRKSGDPTQVKTFEAVWDILLTAWDKPSAAYVRMTDTGPAVTLLVEAGDQAPALAAKLTAALPKVPPNTRFVQVNLNGLLIATFGQPTASPLPTHPITKDARFNSAFKEVGPGLAVLHLDLKSLYDLAFQSAPPQVKQGLRLSGLQDVTSLTLSGNFDQGEWKSNLFVASPTPRKGLVNGFLASSPTQVATVTSIPGDAVTVSTFTLDLPALLTETRSAVKQLFPDQKVDYVSLGLSIANAALGTDLEKSLLAPVGKHWILYQTLTDGIPNLTLVNVSEQSAQFATAFHTLLQSGSRLLLSSTGMRARFWTSRVGSTDVNTVAFPIVCFSYGQAGDRFALASTPQLVAKALATTPERSLAQSPAFASLQKRLDAPAGATYSYIDLPATAPICYEQVMTLLPFIDLVAHQQKFGAYPTAFVPNLDKIIPTLSPAASASWTDDRGWHLRSITPFPGAEVLVPLNGSSTMQQGQVALALSVMLPSLNRARETANRVKCASNLRQIGQGIQLYASEHKGKYPPDLATLVMADYGLGPSVFTCPSSNAPTPPLGADLVAWVNDNAHYHYFGNGLNTATSPDVVVMYEKIDNHDQDGVNILFGDGRVEFCPARQLPKVLELSKTLGGKH